MSILRGENKKRFLLATFLLAACAEAKASVPNGRRRFQALAGETTRSVVAFWRSNVASFRSERVPYLIY
jgi:hypothetical protein